MPEKRYTDFTDLDCWKLAHEIKKDVYKITLKLPKEETYNLKSQARASACSITANIAEGYGRFHYQENIQFCRQARGSLEETRDHLLSIGALYLDLKQEAAVTIRKCLKCKEKINGYISYLRRCKQNETEDEKEAVAKN